MPAVLTKSEVEGHPPFLSYLAGELYEPPLSFSSDPLLSSFSSRPSRPCVDFQKGGVSACSGRKERGPPAVGPVQRAGPGPCGRSRPVAGGGPRCWRRRGVGSRVQPARPPLSFHPSGPGRPDLPRPPATPPLGVGSRGTRPRESIRSFAWTARSGGGGLGLSANRHGASSAGEKSHLQQSIRYDGAPTCALTPGPPAAKAATAGGDRAGGRVVWTGSPPPRRAECSPPLLLPRRERDGPLPGSPLVRSPLVFCLFSKAFQKEHRRFTFYSVLNRTVYPHKKDLGYAPVF